MNKLYSTYRMAAVSLCTLVLNLSSADVHALNVAPAKAPLFAQLLGGNEVGGGDPDGYGSATVIFKGATTICFAIVVSNIGTPTAAHIHEALPGQNGAVVVPLSAPTQGNPGTASGCISGVDSTIAGDIRGNPSSHYVNVHTSDFPGGALRGQLF